jgi:hypothetical protein
MARYGGKGGELGLAFIVVSLRVLNIIWILVFLVLTFLYQSRY